MATIRFSRDERCFAWSKSRRVQLFNVRPLRLVHSALLDGRVRCVEPIYRSGLLVAAGDDDEAPEFAPNIGERDTRRFEKVC